MKKIVWITPDYFVDVDLNYKNMTEILKFFSIEWIVILPRENARFNQDDFSYFKNISNVSIHFIYQNYRARDPRMLLLFEQIYKKIIRVKPDIIYFNEVPASPYILPLYWRLNKQKTIFTAHDGNVKPTFRYPWLSKIVFNLAYNTIKQVNMFSRTQAEMFKSKFEKVKIHQIPLSLKDFGASKLPKRSDYITFFFFGTIHPGKNVGLLIDAACQLHEEGLTGFRISINGNCTEWEVYQQEIKYPNLFELNIRMIRNAEIPDLFAENHYMVFPYKEMSQSGALKIAFNYNVPVIVSNLQGFTDEVEEGINGYIFESENVDSLKNVMKQCIKNHKNNYEKLCSSTSDFSQQHYSQKSISKRYIEMFDYILKKNK